ncbi:hypothetical protein [Chryseobacterium sp.]|uniref:TRAFAC clade GTPase domain-containing protein n=1 Tax=Chryseobacterium sp. TaxID=1871047 RepID=UPI003340947F
MSTSILLIGKPHSSKTVFLSQFYSKLQKNKSALKLYKPVEDLSPISAARDALALGEEPQTTPAEKSAKFFLPIQTEKGHVDLQCPEYGGEQILNIVDNRSLNKEWTKSVSESDSWVLFIRLNNLHKALDISDLTFSEEYTASNNVDKEDSEFRISDQSFFIELLQILLHYKNCNRHLLSQKVKLTVVLTCWDEIKETNGRMPVEILESELPLFLSFIKSNWASGNLNIIGLSAQEFALDNKENQERYQIEGPEEFGYLILSDGKKTKDITQLIDQALL